MLFNLPNFYVLHDIVVVLRLFCMPFTKKVRDGFGGKSSGVRQPDMGKSGGKRPGFMTGKPKGEKMSKSVKSKSMKGRY